MNIHNEQIAAISIFGAYRENHKDAYDVIADFTKAAIAIKKDVEITPEVIQGYLHDLYSLDIPISIIKGVIKNRLSNHISKSNGVYRVNSFPHDGISAQIDELTKSYNVILKDLKAFLSNQVPTMRHSADFIVSQFAKFIIDDYADDELSPYFSAYIISRKDSMEFKAYFERFEIGLISYYGLQYFDNSNNIGSWSKDCRLCIYLDAEFLFDCADYNDSYYKKIFDEFKSLVDEINRSNKDKPVIELKYLVETKKTFDYVFKTAETLIEKKQAPDPSKEALLKIVKESNGVMDVATHKATILAEVSKANITLDTNDYSSFSTDSRFVTFGKEEYEKYLAEYSKCDLDNAVPKIDYYTKVFTIINGLRGGNPKSNFENCRYIFLSNSRIGRRISCDQAKEHNAVPLATDIDWIVSKFWYKLNKSFTSTRIPLSLDIVASSQASLSEDVCAIIRRTFDDIKKKNLPNDVKQHLYAGIRSIPREIELYDSKNLPEILEFISYENTEAFITAQHKMKESASRSEENERIAKQKEGELLKEREERKRLAKENYRLRCEKRHERNKSVITKIKTRYAVANAIYWILLSSLVAFILFIEFKFFDYRDFLHYLIPTVLDIIAIIAYLTKAHKWLYKKIVNKRNIISSALKTDSSWR